MVKIMKDKDDEQRAMIHHRDYKIACLSKEVDRYKTIMIESSVIVKKWVAVVVDMMENRIWILKE